MGLARHINGLQAFKLTDAMIDMHHIITRCEATSLGDEIISAFLLMAPNQTVTEHILLTDDSHLICLKATFQPKDNQFNGRFVTG